MRYLLLSVTAGFLTCMASPGMASPLTYAPVSPAFQPGNPYAGTTLQAVAQAQEKHNTGSNTPLSPTANIAQTVQAALLSQITSQIYNDIFGQNAAASGTFNLGGGNLISFIRVGGQVQITFTDPTNGQTVISVPAP
ncbi:MAG: hypothetical protein JO089_01475 [Alphaproteobacteria bacterium]|nr:hypothetical protein [Alphaproteobacteria bacterium]